MVIGIASALGKAGADIVDMNPGSGGDILFRLSDDAAVFYNISPGGNCPQSDLVSPADILQGSQAPNFQSFAPADVLQGHSHVVAGVDLNQLHCRHSFKDSYIPMASIRSRQAVTALSKAGRASSAPSHISAFRMTARAISWGLSFRWS